MMISKNIDEQTIIKSKLEKEDEIKRMEQLNDI